MTKLIQEKGITILKFGTQWCGPCRMLKPTLEKYKKITQI